MDYELKNPFNKTNIVTKEMLMSRINSLVSELTEVEQKINKLTQATIGSNTIDFN